MPTRRTGWPAEGTAEREYLEDLYWGWNPFLSPAQIRPLRDGYYLPQVMNVSVQPAFSLRDSGDTLTIRLSSFVREWGRWRLRGATVEARKKRGPVRVKTNYPGDTPAPAPIATWVMAPAKKPRHRRQIPPDSEG
jgi:hypothetical protein